MKALLFLPLAAALTVPALASESGSAPSGRVCIYSRDIRSTTIPDNHTIVFRLYSGKTYVNTLPHECPSLKIENGFVYDGTPNGELCDNLVTIRVVRAGYTCMLGAFTLAPDDKPAQN